MRPALMSAMISGMALIARDTAGEGAADWSIACRRVGFTIAAKVVTGMLIILRRHAAATGCAAAPRSFVCDASGQQHLQRGGGQFALPIAELGHDAE